MVIGGSEGWSFKDEDVVDDLISFSGVVIVATFCFWEGLTLTKVV